jgi:O-antigen ligase
MLFARCLAALPMVMLPFLLGGARPWFWGPIAAFFLIGAAVLLWVEEGYVLKHDFPKGWWIITGLLIAYPALQSIPLPLPWLTVLSPERFLWLQRAGEAAHFNYLAAGISYTPPATLFTAIWWIFLVLYGTLLRNLIRDGSSQNWFFLLLFLISGFEALYGLLQVFIPSMGVLWESVEWSGCARGTFINRNHYAAFQGMLWPVLLACVLTEAGASTPKGSPLHRARRNRRAVRIGQMLQAFTVILSLLTILLSRSRAGILCAVGAFSIFMAMGGIRSRKGTAVVLGCWLVALGYGAVIGLDQALSRFNEIGDNLPVRLKIWEDTWLLIQDHPLTGIGAGGYATVFQVYQSHLPENLRADHAHNDYLQLAAELGLPAAFALIALVWGYWGSTARDIWYLRRNRSASGDARSSAIRSGALAGSAAFLCHNGVEFNWQIPALQLYFIALLILLGKDKKIGDEAASLTNNY